MALERAPLKEQAMSALWSYPLNCRQYPESWVRVLQGPAGHSSAPAGVSSIFSPPSFGMVIAQRSPHGAVRSFPVLLGLLYDGAWSCPHPTPPLERCISFPQLRPMDLHDVTTCPGAGVPVMSPRLCCLVASSLRVTAELAQH